jgi:hypothetical protein
MALTLDGTNGISASGGVNVLQDDSVVTGNLVDGAVTVPKIGATGSPGSGNFLRGDGEWATAGSPPGTLELLQEDIFTTSGTWTKATGYDADDTVMIFVIGGGGSGGATRVSTGGQTALGGSAGCATLVNERYGAVPTASFTFTVGAGGAAVTQTTTGTTFGNAGGVSEFLNTSLKVFFNAEGGGRGINGNRRREEVDGSLVVISTGFGGLLNISPDAGFAGLFTRGGSTRWIRQASAGADVNNEYSDITDLDRGLWADFPNQVVGSGGSAARDGATNRTSWNRKVPALFDHGGNGSGTANGQNATGFGGGGGGCCRQNENATSGAGGGGALVVRYYRGRVTPEQVISQVGY